MITKKEIFGFFGMFFLSLFCFSVFSGISAKADAIDTFFKEALEDKIYYLKDQTQIGEPGPGVDFEEVFDPATPLTILDSDDFCTTEDYFDHLKENDVPFSYVVSEMFSGKKGKRQLVAMKVITSTVWKGIRQAYSSYHPLPYNPFLFP